MNEVHNIAAKHGYSQLELCNQDQRYKIMFRNYEMFSNEGLANI